MRKIYILLVVVLFAITIIGCDRDECPRCHECECVCGYLYENYKD